MFVALLLPLRGGAEVLFGEGYVEALHLRVSEARDSVVVAMYFIIMKPDGKGPVGGVVGDLIDAQGRGVDVYCCARADRSKEWVATKSPKRESAEWGDA